ncbi:hypothetical protein SEA_LUCKYSOCKE_134 [Streptomyces phage LuckySocke]|nr:hypothetical protein SEA_ALONE_139 [Streptomyces phage Alone3]WPH58934.1 hypothetical protein SEA_LUCKYSOCKE_134 [Streptomyces phage LuckySocke]
MARNQREYITTSFAVLTEALGKHGAGDPDKVMAQWDIHTPHGWAEVYDYKDEHESPEDVEVWHVQADSEEAFEYVYSAIRDAASRLGEPAGLGES